jgi:hypothetical protein
MDPIFFDFGLSPHAPFATVEDWSKLYMASYICPNHGVSHYAGFLWAPTWLSFEVSLQVLPITLPSLNLSIPYVGGIVEYILSGIIYHSSEHFTSCFLDCDNTVWSHDGQLFMGTPLYLFRLTDIGTDKLRSQVNKSAHMYLYRQCQKPKRDAQIFNFRLSA